VSAEPLTWKGARTRPVAVPCELSRQRVGYEPEEVREWPAVAIVPSRQPSRGDFSSASDSEAVEEYSRGPSPPLMPRRVESRGDSRGDGREGSGASAAAAAAARSSGFSSDDGSRGEWRLQTSPIAPRVAAPTQSPRPLSPPADADEFGVYTVGVPGAGRCVCRRALSCGPLVCGCIVSVARLAVW
jgi:hypothetical protein